MTLYARWSVNPVITVNKESDTSYTKTKSITITLSYEGNFTFSPSATERQYCLSTSKTSLTGGDQWTTYTSGGTITLGSGKTGTFYLFVKRVKSSGDEESVSGGTSTQVSGTWYQVFGPYNFDNTVPTITLSPTTNTTYAKSRTVTVTVSDAHVGLAANAKLKYGWSNSASTAPTYTEVTVSNVAGAKSGTFTATKNSGTGDFYLWVAPVTVKDTLGNTLATTSITKSQVFKIDNTAPSTPTLTNTSNGSWTNQNVTVTATSSDAHSGVNKIEYSTDKTTWKTDWSTSLVTTTGTNKSISKTWSTETNITVYARAVDAVGNTSAVSTGTAVKIDNTAPTITLSEQTNATYARSRTVTVTIKDTGGSGLAAENKLKYGWSNSTSITPSYKDVTLSNTAGESTATFDATIGSGSGDFYLWVVVSSDVKDVAGNSISTATTIKSGVFKIDNTAPTAGTLTMNIGGAGGPSFSGGAGIWMNQSVYIKLENGSDAHSQVKTNTFSITEGPVTAKDKTGEMLLETQGQYTIVVTTIDNVGLSSTRTYYVNIDKGMPTGTVTASATATNKNTVTIYVSNVSDTGDSGIDFVGIKGWFGTTYVSKSQTKTATYDGTSKRYSATFTFSELPNTTTGTANQGNGTYTFNADVFDRARNVYTTNSVNVIYDTVVPTIKVEPAATTTYAKSTSVKITIGDTGGSGLASTNKLEYYVSDSDKALSGGASGTYTSDTAFNIGANLTGTYYLYVRQIADKAGNVSAGTTITSNNVVYHRFGPYKFDNTNPTIGNVTAKPSSETTYNITISEMKDTTNTTDQSGIKGYYVSTTSTKPADSATWGTGNSTTDKWLPNEAASATFANAAENTTYYVWTIDKAGNISESKTVQTKTIYYGLNNTAWYETFESLMQEASSTTTNNIKVLKDVTESTSAAVTQNAILDTNGKTMTTNTGITVKSAKTLEIKGTGTVKSGTAGYATQNEANATTTLNGATINGIMYASGGTINIESGTVSGTIYGGTNGGSGTVDTSNINIKDGTITANVFGGHNHGTGTVKTANIKMTGGTVNWSIQGGAEGGSGSVQTANINVSGGTIKDCIVGGTSGGTGRVDTAKINISGGEILKDVCAGPINGSGSVGTATLTMTKGTVGGNVYGGGHKWSGSVTRKCRRSNHKFKWRNSKW